MSPALSRALHLPLTTGPVRTETESKGTHALLTVLTAHDAVVYNAPDGSVRLRALHDVIDLIDSLLCVARGPINRAILTHHRERTMVRRNRILRRMRAWRAARPHLNAAIFVSAH